MDYSAANHALWNVIVQMGTIAGAILLANMMRQRIDFILKSMMPIAVLGGFLLLIAKYLMEDSDERHPLSMTQILNSLRQNGVEAERKSVFFCHPLRR